MPKGRAQLIHNRLIPLSPPTPPQTFEDTREEENVREEACQSAARPTEALQQKQSIPSEETSVTEGEVGDAALLAAPNNAWHRRDAAAAVATRERCGRAETAGRGLRADWP